MLTWTIKEITLDLKYTWKISRNATDQKKNLIVTMSDNKFTGSGEAAPNVRYKESAELGLQTFPFELNETEFRSAKELSEFLRSRNIFNSLAFAIESAWIHYHRQKQNASFHQLMGIPPLPYSVPISYTIPIMDTATLRDFYEANNLSRFKYIKLKVNKDDAYESLKHLTTFCKSGIMVDANESFIDVEECIRWIEKIKKLPVLIVEQPLPSSMREESEYFKKYCPFPVFADEAMTDEADFGQLKRSFDGVNMKLMKAGGYLNGIRLLKEARQAGLQTMIGCMVETTLGISSALKLCGLVDYADLDSFLLVKDEPYHLVNEKDGELSLANSTDI